MEERGRFGVEPWEVGRPLLVRMFGEVAGPDHRELADVDASPTTLYRKVCRSLPMISSAIGSRNESALTKVICELLADLDRAKARKKRKNRPSTRQTLDENITYD